MNKEISRDMMQLHVKIERLYAQRKLSALNENERDGDIKRSCYGIT